MDGPWLFDARDGRSAARLARPACGGARRTYRALATAIGCEPGRSQETLAAGWAIPTRFATPPARAVVYTSAKRNRHRRVASRPAGCPEVTPTRARAGRRTERDRAGLRTGSCAGRREAAGQAEHRDGCCWSCYSADERGRSIEVARRQRGKRSSRRRITHARLRLRASIARWRRSMNQRNADTFEHGDAAYVMGC